MPIEVTTLEDVRNRYQQQRKSLVGGLSEWQELNAKLAEGLKPQEAIVITLKADTVKKLGKNARGTFKRHTRKLVKKLKLDSKYSVSSLKDSTGVDVVIVAYDAPITTKRR